MMTQLDDSILVAYVDGQLDAATKAMVAEALARDSDAQEKLRLLRRSAALVRAAFPEATCESVPNDLIECIDGLAGKSPRPTWSRRIALPMAASIALAALAFGGGYAFRGFSDVPSSFADQLVDEVADYHAVYARQVRHQVELPASERSELERWFGHELHGRFSIPDLSDHGLNFRGGRLLVVDGHPVAQLLYAHPNRRDQPLALCVTRDGQGILPITYHDRNGLELAIWRSDGIMYALVGWEDRNFLGKLVSTLPAVVDRS